MEITNVRVHVLEGGGRVRALASMTIADAFVVHDIRVVDGQNGMFISMPSRRKVNGEYIDIAHPITTESRQKVESAILDAYGRALGAQSAVGSAGP